MPLVKLKDKDELDKLVASLTLRLGHKVSQQDVLDACIRISSNRIEELERFFSPKQTLTKQRIKQILKMADDFDYETRGSLDQDLYGT
jgi:hypothetical protein